MTIRSKLANPFLLIGQGFVAGAVVFFALAHTSGEAHSPAVSGGSAKVEAATR